MKILIADDHEIVRRGLKQILNDGFAISELGEACDCPSLVKKAIEAEWDIIISDLVMPGGGGSEALKQLKVLTPKIPVLILSSYSEEQYAIRMIKAGASGYLSKEAVTEDLLIAVNRILSGRRYITEAVAQRMADKAEKRSDVSSHELLSDREWDVFINLAKGKSITEICEMLSLRSTTVSTYRSRVLQKMDLRNNTDIVQYAIENNLL